MDAEMLAQFLRRVLARQAASQAALAAHAVDAARNDREQTEWLGRRLLGDSFRVSPAPDTSEGSSSGPPADPAHKTGSAADGHAEGERATGVG